MDITSTSIRKIGRGILTKARIMDPIFPEYMKPFKGDVDLPKIIEIEPIDTCNLNCTMCHVSFEDKHDTQRIDPKLLLKLNSIKGAWVKLGSNYEPTMHPGFVTMMKILSDNENKIDLTTNAVLLTEKRIEEISQTNLKRATISFDGGTSESYEKIRRNSKFQPTVDKIRNLRSTFEDNCFFAVNSVLMKSNIDETWQTIKFWNSEGINQVRFIFMVIRSLEKDKFGQNNLVDESLFPIKEHAFNVLDQSARNLIQKKLAITINSPYYQFSDLRTKFAKNFNGNVVMSDNPSVWDDENPMHYHQVGYYPGMEINCRSPFTFARILFNGDVQMCYKYVIGNLHEKTFEDIWYGERAQQVRSLVLTNTKVCQQCDFYRFCLSSTTVDPRKIENYVAEHLRADVDRIFS